MYFRYVLLFSCLSVASFASTSSIDLEPLLDTPTATSSHTSSQASVLIGTSSVHLPDSWYTTEREREVPPSPMIKVKRQKRLKPSKRPKPTGSSIPKKSKSPKSSKVATTVSKITKVAKSVKTTQASKTSSGTESTTVDITSTETEPTGPTKTLTTFPAPTDISSEDNALESHEISSDGGICLLGNGCPMGKITDPKNPQKCIACKGNTQPDYRQEKCILKNCPENHFRNAKKTCEKCPIGKRQGDDGKSCMDIAPQPKNTGTCPDGQKLDPKTKKCVKGSSGKDNSGENDGKRRSCPANHIKDAQKKCVKCKAGTKPDAASKKCIKK